MATTNGEGPGEDPGEDQNVTNSFRKALTGLLTNMMDPHRQKPVEELSNDDVLSDRSCKHERLPTLSEVHNAHPTQWWLSINVEKEENWRDFTMNVRNAAFLKEMRHSRNFHHNLAPVRDDATDVWVLCGRYATTVESWRHWSVLVHGQIHHLAKLKENGTRMPQQTADTFESLPQTGLLRKLLAKQKQRTPIAPRTQDFSHLSTGDSIDDSARKTKFVAYHVGQTLYSREEVAKLAEATVKQMEANHMGSYDVFQNNCQHFVLALVRRIVMTQRKPIAVGGTRLQIAHWSVGKLPGYELVPWLSPWKRRARMLPESYSGKPPKRQIIAGYLPFAAQFHSATTLPRLLTTLFWEKSWVQIFQDFRACDDFLEEARRQWKTWEKPDFPKYDYSTIFLWNALFALVEVVACLTFAMAVGPLGIPVAFLCSSGIGLLSGTGPVVYLCATKLIFNRSSLTIQHFDLKQTGPGAHGRGIGHADDQEVAPRDGGERVPSNHAKRTLCDDAYEYICDDADDGDDDPDYNENMTAKFDERLQSCRSDIENLEGFASKNVDCSRDVGTGSPLCEFRRARPFRSLRPLRW